jgi:hypothetical protein
MPLVDTLETDDFRDPVIGWYVRSLGAIGRGWGIHSPPCSTDWQRQAEVHTLKNGTYPGQPCALAWITALAWLLAQAWLVAWRPGTSIAAV